jgi:hypothetical protein
MIKLFGTWVLLKELPTEEQHNWKRDDGSTVTFRTDFMRSGQKLRGDGPFEANVVAVSEKLPELKVGDKVLYDPYSGGYELKLHGEEYFITKHPNIWAVVE